MGEAEADPPERLVLETTALSPGDEFTVDVVDANGGPIAHGYLLIVDARTEKGWEPAWVLGAPWGRTEEPSWRRWDGYLVSLSIGLRGPLHYRLPPDITPGDYRLREPNARSDAIDIAVDA
jgi:hypothetical protein